MATREASVFLTQAQQNKLAKHQTFQVTAEQLQKSPNTIVEMLKPAHTKLNANIRGGRGYRFQANSVWFPGDDSGSYDEVEGGRISFKKLGRKIKRGAAKVSRQAVNAAVDSLATNARRQTGLDFRDKQQMKRRALSKARSVRGQAIKDLKSAGKEVLTTSISGGIGAGAAALGTELAGGNPAGGIIAAKLADQYISKPLNKKASKAIDGAGLKLIKGSQAAKEHMAMLRQKRKSISGGALPNSTAKKPKVFSTTKNPIHKQTNAGGAGAYMQDGVVRPTGSGEFAQINRINPRVNNPKQVRGGSFRPISGGSFKPIEGGSFMPL